VGGGWWVVRSSESGCELWLRSGVSPGPPQSGVSPRSRGADTGELAGGSGTDAKGIAIGGSWSGVRPGPRPWVSGLSVGCSLVCPLSREEVVCPRLWRPAVVGVLADVGILNVGGGDARVLATV